MARLEKMTDPILTSSHFQPRMTLTISSILRILLTVSEARVMELVDTRSGCTTFSSRMLAFAPFLTLIPFSLSVPERAESCHMSIWHRYGTYSSIRW